MLQAASKVTIEVKNAQIEQVMNMALKDQPLTFTIKGRTVFIMKKVEEERKSVQVERTGDPITVSGRVTDENGEPLAGANVKVKGGSNGVTTDAQGRFTLSGVDPNASLEVSFVGREMQTIAVKGKSIFSVTLGQKVGTLDETVVIAYGTTTKRFQTGNVSTVKGEDIQRQPVNNVLLALEGRVPGLFISQKTGIAGGAISVRVQGQNSINYGNDPLYIVDGVPILSQLPTTGVDFVLGQANSTGAIGTYGNPLAYLNLSEIESVEILKDADATAIYGSRAANGAILITTKKGNVGKGKIEINMQKGWGKVPRRVDMLNTRQYLEMRYEALRNDGIDLNTASAVNSNYSDLKVWDTTFYTDWQNELIGGTAGFTNFNVNFSGGTSQTQYSLGSTYNKETTVYPGNLSDQKIAVHFSLNTVSINQKFRLVFSSNYLNDNNILPTTDLTSAALLTEPNAPSLYDRDGSLNWAPNSLGVSTWTNPLVQVLYSTYNNKTKNLISNAQFSYAIIPGLDIKTSLGYTNTVTNDFTSTPLIAIRPEERQLSQRTATYGNRNINTWIIEPQLSYDKKIFKGALKVLVGSSIQKNEINSSSIVGTGYNSDKVLRDVKSAASVSIGSTYASTYKYNAVFGRITYNFLNKYLINLTGRRDGTSRFGEQNKFHNFWGVGGGWIFTQERFLKPVFLSFGKLKGSFGTTGSDQIDDYIYLSLYRPVSAGVPYQSTTGLAFLNLPNPYIQWEETKKLQLGLELGLLNDRILAAITVFRNRSSNQLLNYSLPMITGNQSVKQNFPATIENKGWEFSLNSKNVLGKKIKWSTSINITIPKNKLVKFPNLSTSSYSNDLVVGNPINLIKAYDFIGVDPVTGKYQYANINGEPVFIPNSVTDRIFFVNTTPQYYGGLQNNIQIREFQIDFLFQFVKQAGSSLSFNNGTIVAPGSFISGSSNQPISVINRWQKASDNSSVQKYSADLLTVNDMIRMIGSSAAYSDASFIRLKNISLSWQIPPAWKQKLHVLNLRVYLQCQNLLTITNYKGMDPENQSINSLPPLRVLTTGVQIGL